MDENERTNERTNEWMMGGHILQGHEETDFLVSMLLKDIRASRAQPYIE